MVAYRTFSSSTSSLISSSSLSFVPFVLSSVALSSPAASQRSIGSFDASFRVFRVVRATCPSSVHLIPARKSTPLLAPHLPVMPRAIRPIPLSASLVRAAADPSKNMTSPHLNFAPNHLDKSTTCSTPLPFRLHVSFYLPRHSRPVAYISSVVLSFGSLAETHWLPSHLRGLLITKPTALLRHRNFLPRAAPSPTHEP